VGCRHDCHWGYLNSQTTAAIVELLAVVPTGHGPALPIEHLKSSQVGLSYRLRFVGVKENELNFLTYFGAVFAVRGVSERMRWLIGLHSGDSLLLRNCSAS
jgi:hypothetical protein